MYIYELKFKFFDTCPYIKSGKLKHERDGYLDLTIYCDYTPDYSFGCIVHSLTDEILEKINIKRYETTVLLDEPLESEDCVFLRQALMGTMEYLNSKILTFYMAIMKEIGMKCEYVEGNLI